MTLPELMSIKGIGKKRFKKIMSVMLHSDMTLKDVYEMSPEALKEQFGIPIHVAQRVASVRTQPRQRPLPEKQTHTEAQDEPDIPAPLPAVDRPLTVDDVLTLTPQDENYPQRLRHILGDDTPPELHVWGNLALLGKPAVGFCGSRNVSDKGLSVTEDVARQISERDWVVVSGHARGVDATAHLTALKHNAGTIIVLPQGLNGFKLRVALRKYTTADNVLLVSEFSLYAGWNVGYAMQRNATIIGLSDAMVLVESRSKGGTFNAGKKALSLGHPLFVVHFQKNSDSNAGNKYFLQRGATQLMKNRKSGQANILPLVDRVQHRLTLNETGQARQMSFDMDSDT